jgi:hypothetical protein
MSATVHLDQLRAALRYSKGAGRREIARLVAEQAAAAEAAYDAAIERAIARQQPRPLRWCLWCGDTLAPSVAGEFCNSTCEDEDAAAAG